MRTRESPAPPISLGLYLMSQAFLISFMIVCGHSYLPAPFDNFGIPN